MNSNKHKWTDYFRDTTHGTLDLGKVYLRWLPGDRRDTVDKEYWAQKIISSVDLAPEPYFKVHFPFGTLPSLIFEEKIDFHKVYKKTDNFITDTAKALRKMHDVAREKKEVTTKYIPEDNLLVKGTYGPLTILKVFVTDPLKKLKQSKSQHVTKHVESTLSEIEKRIINLSKKTKYTKEYCSLIHGDLNDTNIVRDKKGKIVVIDWADCRWDIVTCDLSQFIYLHFLNKREQKLFLEAYGAAWVTEEMIEIHRLLLIGWDIIYLMTVNLDYEPDKADRLEPLKDKVWNKAISPL
jgi:thiamine kinase-like enzyme